MASLENILKFVDLLQKFREVERRILVKGSERRENDSEHSFSLAILAWYVNETYELGLDLEKIFKYSLAHDLVEVYAGDAFFYADGYDLEEKQRKEKEASKKLRDEFPEFPELHEAIDGYEKKADKESKFVYALDKVEPILNIYIDEGRSWRKEGVTLEMLKKYKDKKVTVDSTVEGVFKELMEEIENKEEDLFQSK